MRTRQYVVNIKVPFEQRLPGPQPIITTFGAPNMGRTLRRKSQSELHNPRLQSIRCFQDVPRSDHTFFSTSQLKTKWKNLQRSMRNVKSGCRVGRIWGIKNDSHLSWHTLRLNCGMVRQIEGRHGTICGVSRRATLRIWFSVRYTEITLAYFDCNSVFRDKYYSVRWNCFKAMFLDTPSFSVDGNLERNGSQRNRTPHHSSCVCGRTCAC